MPANLAEMRNLNPKICWILINVASFLLYLFGVRNGSKPSNMAQKERAVRIFVRIHVV